MVSDHTSNLLVILWVLVRWKEGDKVVSAHSFTSERMMQCRQHGQKRCSHACEKAHHMCMSDTIDYFATIVATVVATIVAMSLDTSPISFFRDMSREVEFSF